MNCKECLTTSVAMMLRYGPRCEELYCGGMTEQVRDEFSSTLQLLVKLTASHLTQCSETVALICIIPFSRQDLLLQIECFGFDIAVLFISFHAILVEQLFAYFPIKIGLHFCRTKLFIKLHIPRARVERCHALVCSNCTKLCLTASFPS